MKRAALKRSTRLKPVSDKRLANLEKWRTLRNEVLHAANKTCQKCGERVAHWTMLDVHHIKPKGRGGKDERKNLVAICRRCHTLIHDHQEDWNEWIR